MNNTLQISPEEWRIIIIALQELMPWPSGSISNMENKFNFKINTHPDYCLSPTKYCNHNQLYIIFQTEQDKLMFVLKYM